MEQWQKDFRDSWGNTSEELHDIIERLSPELEASVKTWVGQQVGLNIVQFGNYSEKSWPIVVAEMARYAVAFVHASGFATIKEEHLLTDEQVEELNQKALKKSNGLDALADAYFGGGEVEVKAGHGTYL